MRRCGGSSRRYSVASGDQSTMGALPCVHFPHCFCWMKARGYCQEREDAKKEGGR